MKYGFEWTPGLLLVGAVLVLPLVPSFAMIGLVVVALAAVASLVALAGAVLVTPYLLVRSRRRRLAERHQSMEALPTSHASFVPDEAARTAASTAKPR